VISESTHAIGTRTHKCARARARSADPRVNSDSICSRAVRLLYLKRSGLMGCLCECDLAAPRSGTDYTSGSSSDSDGQVDEGFVGDSQGFFRRSIQQKIQYRPCTKNQQCSILRINRNRCQYCRLKKCIAVGMSRDGKSFCVLFSKLASLFYHFHRIFLARERSLRDCFQCIVLILLYAIKEMKKVFCLSLGEVLIQISFRELIILSSLRA